MGNPTKAFVIMQNLNHLALNINFAIYAKTQFMMKGAILMINFIVVFFVGGFLGVMLMALFAANKNNWR